MGRLEAQWEEASYKQMDLRSWIVHKGVRASGYQTLGTMAMFSTNPPKSTNVIIVSIAVIAGALLCENAYAATFPWTNATGSNGQFQWASGENVGLANLYQDPAVLDVGFLFSNTANFRADGGGGSAASVSNLASASVISQAIGPLNGVFVHEWGIWSAGANDDPFQVFTLQADATLTVVLPAGGGTTQFDIGANHLVFNPMDANGVGTWEASGTLIPNGGDWTFGLLNFSNTLQVSSAAAPGSFFEKLGMQATIPEPASLVLLLMGAGPLLLRRRPRR